MLCLWLLRRKVVHVCHFSYHFFANTIRESAGTSRKYYVWVLHRCWGCSGLLILLRLILLYMDSSCGRLKTTVLPTFLCSSAFSGKAFVRIRERLVPTIWGDISDGSFVKYDLFSICCLIGSVYLASCALWSVMGCLPKVPWYRSWEYIRTSGQHIRVIARIQLVTQCH